MKIYKIFEHPSGEIEAIKKGWYWLAFLFTWIWVLFHRLWLVAFSVFALTFTANIVSNFYTENIGMLFVLTVTVLIHLYMGIEGGSFIKRNLGKKGYIYQGTLEGENAEQVIKTYKNDLYPEKHGMTPLMVVAANGELQQAMKILSSGVDVNALDNRGATALMYAAMNGWEDMARNLLDIGASQNIKTSLGLTAADYAKRSGHSEIARILSK